jgi:methylated-DNA-[protein]-cysteine S-methyltransferase
MTPPPSDPDVLVLRGYEPTVRPPVLAEGEVVYLVDDLPVGRLLLATRIDGTLLASSYVATEAETETALDRISRRISPRILHGGRALDTVRRQLDDYFEGRLRSFDVSVDLTLATPFQRTVLERLASTVRYATTTSYGRLAGDLGRPTASRAVGAALGANPLCIVLPCHRVVAASGAPTGYAGGLAAKQFLLDLERAGVPDMDPPDMELGGPAS